MIYWNYNVLSADFFLDFESTKIIHVFFDSGGFVGMSVSTETKGWLFLSFDLEIERLSMPGQF